MSERHKIKIRKKQRLRRRERKKSLLKKGINPQDYFYGKYYIGPLASEKHINR
ncbi:MAG: hypothetical protein N2Z79_03395 [Candidatus Omnitrophica bacterium]|nr:hypothetical protein [Candidatus Omnitrophota bacterium]